MAKQTSNPRILLAYYGATVVFLVLDFWLSINIRATFFDDFPAARTIYYILLFACFLLIILRPAWGVYIAMAESLLALSLIIISTGMRVMIVTDEMITTGRGFVSTQELVNFLIVGGAFYWAYWKNLQAIRNTS